jgi:hypothetical protein
MSYCRWSTDDYQCDLYVYKSSDGWETHVAANRYCLAEPLPAPVPLGRTDAEIRAWVERGRLVSEIIERSTTQPIGLPHDGESYTDPTATACADRLERLRDAGYRVPRFAIDALREEDA